MPDLQTPPAVDRLASVRTAIADAARTAGRDPAEISLVAVSKTFAPEAIEPVIEAGQRLFGENRVQEAQTKWPELKARHPDVELHLIGPLQTNKVKEAVRLFDVIQTLDREKLARALVKERDKGTPLPRLFVQVNTGEETQKAGIAPSETGDFLRFCRDECTLSIDGLMCIPPLEEEPGLHFALLEKIARKNDIGHLSMGMSADFETAIEFGATYVRVGSAIFGERQT